MDNCIDPRDDRADWDDLLVDTTLRRYRCSENARRLDTQQKIVGFQPPHAPLNDQGALSAPLRETQRVQRAKRSVESYPTFAASVQCSNPRMIQAFNAAHYRYIDLIETLATKRLEVAERIDRNELTEDQAKLENAKLYMEMSRDSAAR